MTAADLFSDVYISNIKKGKNTPGTSVSICQIAFANLLIIKFTEVTEDQPETDSIKAGIRSLSIHINKT